MFIINKVVQVRKDPYNPKAPVEAVILELVETSLRKSYHCQCKNPEEYYNNIQRARLCTSCHKAIFRLFHITKRELKPTSTHRRFMLENAYGAKDK